MVREQIGNFLAVAGFHYLTTLLSWLLFWQLLEMRWFDFCEEWIIFPSKSFVSLIHLLLLRTFTAPKISRWNSRLASLEQKFRFWPFHKPLMHREFEPEKVKGRSFQSWSHEILHVARIARCTAQPRFRPEWDPSLPLAKEFCSKIREKKNVTDSSQSVALAVSPSVFIFQTGRNNYSRQHQLLSMKIIFKVCSLRQETTTTKRKA